MELNKVVTFTYQYLIILILTVHLKKCIAGDINEFGRYEISSFDLDANCSYLLHLSPDTDWKYGGIVAFNRADDILKSAPICTRVDISIVPDYTLAYSVQFYVEESRRNSSQQSLNKTQTSFDAFDDCFKDNTCTEEPLCTNCQTDGHIYSSNGSNVRLAFSNISTSIAVVFTLFRKAHFCKSFEYACANQRCIFHSLNCNGYNPCGDHSDCQISYAAMATIAFGGFCVVGLVFLLLFVIVKTRKTSIWSSREIQPKSFSPAKALQTIPSFTPATVTMIMPLQRRWSYKY